MEFLAQFTLLFLTVVYLFETFLDLRQHKKYHIKNLPLNIVDLNITTPEKFQKAQSYSLEKSTFSIFVGVLHFVEGFLTLYYGLIPWLWGTSLSLMENYTNFTKDYEIVHSLIFCGIIMVYQTVKDLPFELYSDFVIEERHGFNKQTLRLFFFDKVKVLLLSIFIGPPILSVILYLISHTGEYFYIYVFVFITIVMLVMMTIYPIWIAPLFNKFTPLEEGELRTKVFELAQSIHYPLDKLFVVDGSRHSSHSNAYLVGIFKKRIVLYDTLLKQLEQNEILAVLAHELGHWVFSHTLKNLVITEFYTFGFLYLFSQFIHYTPLYHAFGFNTQPALIGLILFSLVYEPVDHVFSFIMNIVSRRAEYQADEYSCSKGYSSQLKLALSKLSVENKSALILDQLYSTYHHTHPTLLERLENIDNFSKHKKIR